MNVENIFVTSRAVGQERFLLFFHFLLDRRRSRDSKGSLRCNVQIFLFRPFFFKTEFLPEIFQPDCLVSEQQWRHRRDAGVGVDVAAAAVVAVAAGVCAFVDAS